MLTVDEFVKNMIKTGIGTATSCAADDIWKVPIIGHLIIADSAGIVTNEPILQTSLDYDDYGNYCLDESLGEKVIGVLPALPGEYLIKAAVPENATLAEVESGNYSVRIVTLGHYVPGISEPDWKKELRNQCIEGIVDGT
jgi:hypothetical protein